MKPALSLICITGFIGWGAYGIDRNVLPSNDDNVSVSIAAEICDTGARDFDSVISNTKSTVNEESDAIEPAKSDEKKVSLNDCVNINTADESELDRLPGIGPVLAQKISEYRKSHPAFSVPEDLLSVSGIGEKKLAKMRAILCF